MGKRFYKIIVVSLFLLPASLAYGQEQPKKTIPEPVLIVKSCSSAITRPSSTIVPHFVSSKVELSRLPYRVQSQFLLPPDMYIRQFAFFCRKELQFEKATRIPLRFRLGSLAYSNTLEWK